MEYKIKNEFEQRPLIFDNRISRRYLSVKSLSIFLDVSENTIRKWIERKSIPFVRINGTNTIRFDIKEIERLISP